MDEALWALGRGTGVVSLVLFSGTLVLGIITRSGRPLGRVPRFGVTLLHRNMTLLAVLFLVVHVVTLFFDSYAQLTIVDLVVPFLGAANPLWLGFGTVALDLVVAVTATALLRSRIGARAFRAVHWAAYGLWPFAFAHSLGTGSDVGTVWMNILAATCLAAVLAAVVWRLSGRFDEYATERIEVVR